MKTIINVNRHIVNRNEKAGESHPPLSVKTYKDNTYTDTVRFVVGGEEIGRLVYRPNNPLPCGARVWMEFDSERCQILCETP